MIRRPIVASLALVLAVAGISACGGDDDADASASGDGVAIDHHYGTTTVEGRPERVVSLDHQWTDVFLAMEEAPVGYGLDPNLPDGQMPWQGDQLDESEGLDMTDGIPYEKVAALEPDLIVVGWAAEDEAIYDRLSEIAPTIPLLGDRQVDLWQDLAAVAGKVLDEPDKATALVAEQEGLASGIREQLPGLAGKTFAMANYVPGDAITVVADREDGSVLLFEQLGLQLAPTILDNADGVSGRAELSLENIGLLDADVLVLFTNGADAQTIVGYDSLPAVQSGAAVVLDYAEVVGLNTPTPLSVPFSLERIRPALDAAAARAA